MLNLGKLIKREEAMGRRRLNLSVERRQEGQYWVYISPSETWKVWKGDKYWYGVSDKYPEAHAMGSTFYEVKDRIDRGLILDNRGESYEPPF